MSFRPPPRKTLVTPLKRQPHATPLGPRSTSKLKLPASASDLGTPALIYTLRNGPFKDPVIRIPKFRKQNRISDRASLEFKERGLQRLRWLWTVDTALRSRPKPGTSFELQLELYTSLSLTAQAINLNLIGIVGRFGPA